MEPDITSGEAARTSITRGRGRGRLRVAGAVGGSLAVGAALLAVTGPVHAIDTSKVGPVDARGFPTYYTDDAGLSLQICEDGSANCGGATPADDGAGGPGLDVAPDGEGFYWSAEADLQTTRGSLRIVMAHEAAWAAVGQPTVFDRLRARGDLSRPGTYTLQTPYGSTKLEVDPAAGQRNVNVTEDLGCSLTPGGLCGGHVTSYLRALNAPAGYLGDSASLSRVTGGTVRNEMVLRAPNGQVVGRTDRFIVMGKLAPGPAALVSADSVGFGNTKRARRRAVVVRNLGDAALGFNRIRLLGGAGRVKVAPRGCGASLAAGASCRVNLTYRPGGPRAVAGTLVINDSSIAATHRVPFNARTTGVASSRRRMHFRATSVGRKSVTRRVVVTNTGVRPMRVRGVSLSGGNGRSFERRSGQGPRCRRGTLLRPRSACAVYVRFAPKNFGPKSTDLRVRTDAATKVHRIVLNGRGR